MNQFKRDFNTLVDLVAHFEGFREDAYRDPVGILTVGYGWTPGVKVTHKTPESMAKAAMAYHLRELFDELREDIDRNYLDGSTGRPSDRAIMAFTDLAYNVGYSAVVNGEAWKRLREGDWPEACARMLMYNRAGGRIFPGLVRRRMAAHVFHFTGRLNTHPTAGDIHLQVIKELKRLEGSKASNHLRY